MVSLEHVTLHYGERALFDDVSCLIGPHDRIGLVGSNGSGKTTLLKIMAGLQQPDRGRVEKAKVITVGYLPQDGISTKGRTLYHEAETAFEQALEVQRDLDEIHESLITLDPSDPSYGEIIEIMGELQHKLEDLDVYRMKAKIERVLMGLGFQVNDFQRQTEEFSGGWQMRIAMAKLLLKEPSLLLLDEPTNHLDLDTLQWLENYLREYNGAIILVSHDRAFLDNLCRRTFALSRGELQEFSGNYSFYEKEKEVRKTLLLNAQKNQQKQLKQTQEFIDRFRYKASKARQVQSRVKQLDKIEIIEVDNEEEQIRFRFPQPAASGRVVLELKDISKSYGENKVFTGMQYKIERGDRVAVIGVNGAGKSTFSRIVAGAEPFDKGQRIVGHNVTASYFAQDQAEELDASREVTEVLDEVATGDVRKRLRAILGSFLFHGDDVFKKISMLSGGEKSRVALARMLLQPANFLIMDEPTNHLDMRSKKVLQSALQTFEGTYLIVSHDRAFLEPIVNKVLEFSHGEIKTYLGPLEDYLRKKSEENTGAPSEAPRKGPGREPGQRFSSKEERQRGANSRKELKRAIQPLKKQVEALEEEIRTLESAKENLEMSLADPELYKRGEEAKSATQKYNEVLRTLELKYAQWTSKTDEASKVEKPDESNSSPIQH
ncbi:MAG: ABC-F family ATP-binding cassette domain-containing protein [Ignavibacteriales bacterium]|nr:ABC-F family ATP-binding cassette domain-containing protein [Ignavibacteriales bacterium]